MTPLSPQIAAIYRRALREISEFSEADSDLDPQAVAEVIADLSLRLVLGEPVSPQIASG